jgi:hypothetical protein
MIIHFEVFAERPDDSKLLLPSLQDHQRKFGRVPSEAAADAGFYSSENDKAVRAMGLNGFRYPIEIPRVRNANVFTGSVVSSWATVEDRMRRSHQRTEAETGYAPSRTLRQQRQNHEILGPARECGRLYSGPKDHQSIGFGLQSWCTACCDLGE